MALTLKDKKLTIDFGFAQRCGSELACAIRPGTAHKMCPVRNWPSKQRRNDLETNKLASKRYRIDVGSTAHFSLGGWRDEKCAFRRRVQPLLKRGGEEQTVGTSRRAHSRAEPLVTLFTVTHELVDGAGLRAALVEDPPPNPRAGLQEGSGSQTLSEGEVHRRRPVLVWNNNKTWS